MRKQNLRSFVATVLWSGILAGLSLPCRAADSTKQQERTQMIAAASNRWSEVFGGVDCTNEAFFKHLVYLHPQPLDKFTAFTNEVLTSEILESHQLWIQRFFKGTLLDALQGLKPAAYYLNGGRVEPGLLLFTTEVNGRTVHLMENCNVILLIVKPLGFNASQGEFSPIMKSIVGDWTNIGQAGQKASAKAFAVPESVRKGEVAFHSANADFLKHRGWPEHTITFVGDIGICTLFMKLDPDRKEMGYNYDFNWLNRGLFAQDGKTLIEPPAIRNDADMEPGRRGSTRLRE